MTTTKTTKSGRRGQPSGPSGLTSSGKTKPRGGRKGRKPVAPVRVGRDGNWGPIMMFVAVGVVAAAIIGYAFWAQRSTEVQDWQERAAAIEGIIDYRSSNPEVMTAEYRRHVTGTQVYDTSPPVAGPHNEVWQNCQGDVYSGQIPNEHAVHSLEHGAVWITYNPDTLPSDQVETLANLVRQAGDKMMMSQYPGLETPLSLQAWGYQLFLEDANDPRVNEFIRTLRGNTSLEGMTAACSGGVSIIGNTPIG